MAQNFRMIRKTYAEISIENLKHNFTLLKSLNTKDAFMCPMIKSSAYGHGDVEVAKALVDEGAKSLGVALVEEGVRLKESGIINEQILVYGPFGHEAIETVKEHDLIPVVSMLDQLDSLCSSGENFLIHLKLNTGMNRLGFSESELGSVAKLLHANPQIKVQGICSHLAQAEDFLVAGSSANVQLNNLKKMLSQLPVPAKFIHLFNSAGLLANSIAPQASWGGRPGISLYGVKPKLDGLGADQVIQWNQCNLKPVMTLKSEIIAYNSIKKGEKVSYGGTWVAQRNSHIGVIPIGYADGYHRTLSNSGSVMYRGKKLPVVGTVCMDYTMVDLTDVLRQSPDGEVKEVILFGEDSFGELPVEDLAKQAGTISYEFLAGLGKRVPRKYI